MPSILVQILGDMKGFEKSVGGLGSALSPIKSALSPITNTLQGIAELGSVAFVAAGAAVTAFGVSAFHTAARAEEMNVALYQIGATAGYSTAQIDAAVQAVRNQGITMGDAQNAISSLVRGNLDLAQATDLARVAQDLAIHTGQNSSETLSELIHGIQTGSTSLSVFRTLGIQGNEALKAYADSVGKTTTELSAQEKQQAFLNAVLQKGEGIYGSYEAAMETAGKTLRSFPRLFDDMKLSVGNALLDGITPLIGHGGDKPTGLYGLVSVFSKSLQPGGAFGGVLEALRVKLKDLTGPLVTIVEKVTGWVKGLDQSSPIVENLTDKLAGFGPVAAGAGAALATMGLKNIPILGDLFKKVNPLVTVFLGMALSTDEGRRAMLELGKAAFAVIKEIGPLVSELAKALLPAITNIVQALAPFVRGSGPAWSPSSRRRPRCWGRWAQF